MGRLILPLFIFLGAHTILGSPVEIHCRTSAESTRTVSILFFNSNSPALTEKYQRFDEQSNLTQERTTYTLTEKSICGLAMNTSECSTTLTVAEKSIDYEIHCNQKLTLEISSRLLGATWTTYRYCHETPGRWYGEEAVYENCNLTNSISK